MAALVRSRREPSAPSGPLNKGDATPEVGGDLHWGVTPNVSVNATVHPDFSQVEADVALVTVNERFALSYPEKRPFFLEGAGSSPPRCAPFSPGPSPTQTAGSS